MQKTFCRTFLAIELPPQVQSIIATKLKLLPLQDSGQPVKWIKPANLHLTLHFLGRITAEQVVAMSKKFRVMLKSFQPFLLNLEALQLFPASSQSWVLVLKPEPVGPIKHIAQVMRHAISACGVRCEHRIFKPHITVGRIKTQGDKVCQLGRITPISFTVTTITLFTSQLHAAGSIYTSLASYRLA